MFTNVKQKKIIIWRTSVKIQSKSNKMLTYNTKQ